MKSAKTGKWCRVAQMTASRQGIVCDQDGDTFSSGLSTMGSAVGGTFSSGASGSSNNRHLLALPGAAAARTPRQR